MFGDWCWQLQVELMESKFAEYMSNEKDRLDRDVQQADEKSAVEASERDRHRQEEWTAICRSRTQQLELRKAGKEQAMQEERAFIKAWQVRAGNVCMFMRLVSACV
jgi:hypothetical protein